MEVILKDVRGAFLDIWRPGKPGKNGSPGKYSVNGIMARDSEAFKLAQETFIKAAQETFGANWQNMVAAMEKNKKCIRDGNLNLHSQTGAIRDGFAGLMYIVAKNKVKPIIVGMKKGPDGKLIELTEDGGKPYGGCRLNLKVDIFAMKAKDEIPAGVYAKVLAVQFYRDDQAFGSGPGTADGFDDEGDEGEAPSTGNADNLFG